MASKEQFEFFKSVYADEESRYRELIDRGKIILSLATLYTGFLAFTVERNSPASSEMFALFAAAVILLLTSFLLSILALGVYSYEGPADPEDILQNYGASPPSDADFFDARIVDYAVAANRNAAQNDRRAKFIFFSIAVLLAGLTLHAIYFLLNACFKE